MKKLTKDFPKSVVKDAPVGKFGSYVPHHLYTQRLVDVIPGGYDFTFEETRDKNGAIIGAKCKLYIKSTEQTIEEVGDVDTKTCSIRRHQKMLHETGCGIGIVDRWCN